MIRGMRGIEVDNGKHFNQYYLDELTNAYDVPKEYQYLHLDDAPQNTKKMVIGGYGYIDSEQGAGHTRLLPDAEYELHLFATKSDAELLRFFGLFGLSDDMNSIRSHIAKYARNLSLDTNPMIDDGHLISDSATTRPVYCSEAKSHPLYIEGIITNVHRDRLSYRGDITLHVEKYIGQGDKYVNPEHMKGAESLRTDAVLFSRSMVGSAFRRKIRNRMNIMSDFADKSGIKYDSKNWLLLVNNV
jgi:hypothetical protein